jgi:hypothetical protein
MGDPSGLSPSTLGSVGNCAGGGEAGGDREGFASPKLVPNPSGLGNTSVNGTSLEDTSDCRKGAKGGGGGVATAGDTTGGGLGGVTTTGVTGWVTKPTLPLLPPLPRPFDRLRLYRVPVAAEEELPLGTRGRGRDFFARSAGQKKFVADIDPGISGSAGAITICTFGRPAAEWRAE